MEYRDYFDNAHISGNVLMDEFVEEAMRNDIKISVSQKSIDYLNTSRITLKNEVLTCYQFMKEKGLLETYHKYRDGE